jgi:hypothetical protein
MIMKLKGHTNNYKIYGVGRSYNDEIGQTVFRTGGRIELLCSKQKALVILRTNILKACDDYEHCIRLVVKNDRFWFDDSPAELVCTQVLFDANDLKVSIKSLRTQDTWQTQAPASICIVEEMSENTCSVSWLFRHDVIDGWRALKYLFTLSYEASTFKTSIKKPVHKTHFTSFFNITRAIMNAGRILHTPKLPSQPRKLYVHLSCPITRLKSVGGMNNIERLTDVIKAIMVDATFKSDKTLKSINVAHAVLYNPVSSHGNHCCLKVCNIQPKKNSIRQSGYLFQRNSQIVTDSIIMNLSKAYSRGKILKCIKHAFERHEEKLNILVSSLPGCETTEPVTKDVQVCREKITWTPNVVYCIGTCAQMHMDIYWQVDATFEEYTFFKCLKEHLPPTRFHTELPKMY